MMYRAYSSLAPVARAYAWAAAVPLPTVQLQTYRTYLYKSTEPIGPIYTILYTQTHIRICYIAEPARVCLSLCAESLGGSVI